MTLRLAPMDKPSLLVRVQDSTVLLWDAHTGEYKQTLKGHTESDL